MAIVTEAIIDLKELRGEARRRHRLLKARRQIERIRKQFKRVIDERARMKPGDAWFAFNARESIEQKLTEATSDALAALQLAYEYATETTS